MPKKSTRLQSRLSSPRDETLDLRLEPGEKEAFKKAADLAGVPVSMWVRERLRVVARRELEAASLPIPFLRHLYEDGT